MSDVSGIPNMGFGGGAYFGGYPMGGLSAAQINASIWGNANPQMQQQQLASLYGPMGFGGQTAMYSGIGAGYGRATGGFNAKPGAYGTINNPFSPSGPPSAPLYSGGGIGSDAARAPNQPSIQPFQPPMAFKLPPSSPAGGTAFIDPDIASRTGQLGMPNSQKLLGYDPAKSAMFAPGSGEGFQGRFGMGFPNAGTPSQYTTAPYTGVDGITHQPNIPAGFETPFSVDNPGGALSARGLRGGSSGDFLGASPPIMNQGDDESSDTLTPSDRTAPGGFYGGAFNPAQFQSGKSFGTGSIGGAGGMGSAAALNTYGLPGGGGMGAFGGRGGLTAGTGSIGAAPGDMSNFVSPSNNYNTFQKGASYPWTQQVPGNNPNIMNAVYGAAGKVGADPAALAGMIGMENPQWDPRAHNKEGYWGMTQMGPGTFKDAGGRLGGMTWDQYKGASAEKQIGAYPDWLNTGARIPGSGANLVAGGGIGSLPPPMQTSVMQATQFAPNATGWVDRLGQGDMTTPTTLTKQAEQLREGGALKYPSINSMHNYFDRTMRGAY